MACEKYIEEAGAYRRAMNGAFNISKKYLNKDFDSDEEIEKTLKQYKKYDKRIDTDDIDKVDASVYHTQNNDISAQTPNIIKDYKKASAINKNIPIDSIQKAKEKEEIMKRNDRIYRNTLATDRKNKESWMKAHGNVGTDPNEKKAGKYLDMYNKKKEEQKKALFNKKAIINPDAKVIPNKPTGTK